jgi:hypothetical protein
LGKADGLNTQVLLANLQHQQHHHLKLLLFHSWFISFPFFILGGQKVAVSDSAEGWCAAGNLRASRVSIRMDDRTDG